MGSASRASPSTAVQVLAFMRLAATCGCNRLADFGDYQDFFALPSDQQLEAIQEYPLEAQVDIYLLNQRLFHRMTFVGEIAENRADIVPILRRRLAAPESRKAEWELTAETYDILFLFSVMQADQSYEVAADPALMRLLDQSASSLEDERFRDQTLHFVETIRTSGETRNGPFTK